ncbi:BglG family transcription antiterminator LicT [Faecalibacillus intestinalis]|jgi:beta-glucoside operon transcriptional antiterminator|uniref:BglG family transcription antiterminator LicT n=1 Tax=Faecalibacillus intestinalis TaxID=1982626 RepID=UPI000E4ABF5F|nr:PRD domain-containing protein [Faecalibacillus intestinalis]RGF49474.1 PRD domain-containing protein [Coprobacillus sp. AF37-2]RGG87265.1 PRD domain-containing protein [Coprobacillus sp. AF17-11AC]RGG95404.1 PRD domain-containing protein [Coprobacillus sp. AF16-47]RGH27857.1 PRD domain-containing protein [Coprobacillus sp. AF02-13]RHR89096.1 PRD domain-containing protein [Coprobacillus sp. AF15-30]RHT91299.1 PRD domain-containing protein [Coprobacillus sp. AM28-15LB]
MIIKRILTNNAVVIDDENQQEKIVCGKGIAFKKRPGMEIDEMSINQTFILEGGGEYSRFEQLLKDVPLEYLELSSEIINMAKLEFAKKFKDNVIITLSDHLYVAIKRCREGMTISNPLLWDIKNFYEIEYDIGLRALELIKNKFHIQLPDDEAGFIALHIVNVELDEDNMDHIFQVTKVIQEIMTIVKYHFHAEFDTSNVYYYRFITHLKFFALRLLKDNQFNEDEENELLDVVKDKYCTSYECVLKIKDFLEKKYNYTLQEDEIVYLTIHVHRVVHKTKGGMK